MKCEGCGLYVHWKNLCCNSCGFSEDYNINKTYEFMTEYVETKSPKFIVMSEFKWEMPNKIG